MSSKAAMSPACEPNSKAAVDCEVNVISAKKSENNFNIIEGRGDFLAGGATGFVELLESGDVIKSPWTGRPTASDCRQEMMIEAQIYERLGPHPRLVQLKHWNPINCTLTLEHMLNGNLRNYMENYGQNISIRQRHKWALEATESIKLLHSHGVLQGDVGPHNFLLDNNLELKICDFGGSSLDGSKATIVPGMRYRLPSLQPATIKEDLFALGSTIYFIATGHEPYHELVDEDQIGKLYEDGIFPDLGGVPFAEAIAMCWRQKAEAAQTILEIIQR